jgi:hypothetical protein
VHPPVIPLTAFALVTEPPGSSRSVSHPASPAMSHASLLIPSGVPGISRSISDNRSHRSSSKEDAQGGGASGRHSGTPSRRDSRRHSRIYFTLSPPVTEAMHKLWRWDFDLFEFIALVPDTPLTTMTCYLLERWGLFNTFNIDRATFHRFISVIESGYRANAYHNAVHAADVVQNMHVLLLGFEQHPSKDTQAGALCTALTPLDVLAAIIAAAIHDYKHDGRTNLFHTNTSSDLAVRYNDVSILENMHLSETFALILRHPEYDIFASLSREQRREIRETMIAMVLATDLKSHVSNLTELQANIEQKKAKGVWFDVSSRTDRLLLLKNCLHISDVSNPTKPTATCVRWADAIVAEWFIQGDMERELGLEISPMMDRNNANVPKSQLGFISFFIKPLFTTWAKVTSKTSIALDYLEINFQYWKAAELKDTQQKQAVEAEQKTTAAASASATGSGQTTPTK